MVLQTCKFAGGVLDAYMVGTSWQTGALRVSGYPNLTNITDANIQQEFSIDQCAIA